MRHLVIVLSAALLLGLSSARALAQEQPSDQSNVTGTVVQGNTTIVFERGGQDLHLQELRDFSQIAQANPKMASEIARKPSSVNDDSFVAKYPALQQFLNQYPNAREDIASNPGDFVTPVNGSTFQHALPGLKTE